MSYLVLSYNLFLILPTVVPEIIINCIGLPNIIRNWGVFVEWLMPCAYLLLDASCTLLLLFSQGSIILIEHFLLSTDYVTVLLASRGLYMKHQLCSLLLSYFIYSIPQEVNLLCSNSRLPDAVVISVNTYHVTSHFFTWKKMLSLFVSLWPCSVVRKCIWFTANVRHFKEQ
jgi:hypothetical protein